MTVSVELSFETGAYDLYVSGGGMGRMPAGPRLAKSQDFPDIKFSHASLSEAEADAVQLKAYFDRQE